VRFSRFISGQRRRQPTQSGALVVAGGRDKREGEHKRQYGRVELFCRGVGVSNRIGSGNALHVGFHDGGFTSNTLSVTSVSTGYEYALTNGNDYTISSSSNFLQLHTMLITRIMLISTTQPVNGYPVLVTIQLWEHTRGLILRLWMK
jgi:hypothetical protein